MTATPSATPTSEADAPTRSVPVVSWYTPQQSGGFDWFFRLEDARVAYEREVNDWGPGTRVRLVEFPVPVEVTAPEGVTDYVDARIEDLEENLPALEDTHPEGHPDAETD